MIRTVSEALQSSSPSLAGMKKELGEQKMIATLTLWITDVVQFFNVNKSMNEEQIVATAKLIYADYYYLKPEDFRLCFDNAKKGLYGKVDFKLDGSVLFGWLGQYIDQRAACAEQLHSDIHNEFKRVESIGSRDRQRERDDNEQEFHKVQLQEYIKSLKKPDAT